METEDSPSRLRELRESSPWRTGPKGGGLITGQERVRPAREPRPKNIGTRNARPVRCKETGKVFESGKAASAAIGKASNCVTNAILKYLRGDWKRPAAGGYTWEYYNGPMA
jgi:hypothetical protein